MMRAGHVATGVSVIKEKGGVVKNPLAHALHPPRARGRRPGKGSHDFCNNRTDVVVRAPDAERGLDAITSNDLLDIGIDGVKYVDPLLGCELASVARRSAYDPPSRWTVPETIPITRRTGSLTSIGFFPRQRNDLRKMGTAFAPRFRTH